MKRLLPYTREIWLWSFKKYPLVVTPVAIILAFVPISIFGASEPSIRITGMFLQIIGLIPVFFSILELRREFGLPGIIETVKSAWKDFPKYHPPPNTMSVSAGLAVGVSANLAASGSVGNPADESLEKQIEALRSGLEALRIAFEQNKKTVNDTMDRHRRELSQELQGLATQQSRQADKLKSVHTTGLAWSASGAIWIGVGIILSSMSVELHGLLGTSMRPANSESIKIVSPVEHAPGQPFRQRLTPC